MTPSYEELAGMLDHSMLHPTFTAEQFDSGISLALAYGTASVCLMPWYAKRCSDRLAGSSVRSSTVIGFPHGGHTTPIKAREAEQALRDGVQELDMVINVSAALSGDWDRVGTEIRTVTKIAHAGGARIKIIFETCYLNDEQKIRLCELCAEAGVDWVKTSTGFGTSGAVDEDLRLMRRHSHPPIQVKASGGIRTLERVLEVRNLGVSRVGTSATQAILDEARASRGLPPVLPDSSSGTEGVY